MPVAIIRWLQDLEREQPALVIIASAGAAYVGNPTDIGFEDTVTGAVARDPSSRRSAWQAGLTRNLSGAEIDYIDTLQQSGFTINNPNAQSTCACGDSFH